MSGTGPVGQDKKGSKSASTRSNKAEPQSQSEEDVEKSLVDATTDDEPEIVQPTPAQSARGRGGKSKQSSMKRVPVLSVGDTTDEEPEIVEPTPSRAPPKRRSYATPASPAYVGRVESLDTEHRVRVEQNAMRARQAFAKSHVDVVTLRWWSMVRARKCVCDS